MKKLIPVLLILLFSLSVILFSGCSPEDAVGGGAVDKTALISLLEDFEKIPKTIDQATLISAYIQIRDNENATQKEVSQAVNGLKELRDTIYATPMSFIDGGLEPHVRKALGFDSDTMITIGDCLGLTELDCSYGEGDTKIRVSYDFRYFPNLTVLDLGGNGVEDLSGFAYLSDLVKLDLSDNPARSSNLNEEDSEAEVRSFDILRKLPLAELDLSGEGVLPSLSVLPEISSLETLIISENRLENLDGIGQKFPNLKSLYASDCSLEQISSLSGCTKLENLYLERSRITDLSGITSLVALKELDLDGAVLTDYSALANLSDLSGLSLAQCGISDISWISQLTGLAHLDLSGNLIEDCSQVSKTSVKSVNLSNNMLKEFSLTDSWAEVTDLNLSGNRIASFSVVTGNGDCALTTLSLKKNVLTQISLGNCSALASLDLSENALTDLALRSSSVATLDISENPMQDLLLDLPSLRVLYFNCASDFNSVTLSLPELKTLTMQQPFSSAVDFLSSLTGLESLTVNLSHEKAPTLPELPGLTQLTLIGVSDGRLSGFMPFGKVLHLTVRDSSVVVPSMNAFPALLSLSFEGCGELSDLSGLTVCSALESVSVKGGKLPAPQVSGLENLKTLALNGCGVKDLSLVNGLPSLESLSLSGNGLEMITVTGYTKLQNLDLSNNLLASADALTLDLEKGVLNLSGNPEKLYGDLPPLAEGVTLVTDRVEE